MGITTFLKEERSQAKARFGHWLAAIVYSLGLFAWGDLPSPAYIILAISLSLFGLYTVFILYSIKKYAGDYPVRRILNIFVDLSAASILMFVIGEYGAIFYAIYLWVIIGNGIRFGNRYLFYAMALGTVCFYILITNAPYWKSQEMLSYGLLIGCLVLPLFFISIIRRLHQQNVYLEKEIKARTQHLVEAEEQLLAENENLEIVVVARTRELEDIIELLTDQSIELQNEVSRRAHVENELKLKALYDPLTQLPNRVLLYEKAEKTLANAKRYEFMVAVIFIDIDNFKYINDNYGHDVGDTALVELSLRVVESVREIDIVSRLGGDEFVVILTQCDSYEDISVISKRILSSLSSPLESASIGVATSSSMGVSIYPDDSLDWINLLKRADEAMYESKNAGKNKISYAK